MRGARAIGTVFVLALAGPAAAASLEGRGVFLPLQDRTGRPGVVAGVEEALLRALAADHELADTAVVRQAMRRERIRDPEGVPASVLDRLGADLEARWFFVATLLWADDGPVPQVVVSGRAWLLGERHVAWAGIEGASGLDEVRVLGRGRVEDLGVLARRTAGRLVDSLNAAGSEGPRPRPEPAQGGFRSPEPWSPGALAVIPFDSVTGTDPGLAAELVTDAAFAVLHRDGVELVTPGVVEEVLRQRGALLLGQLDRLTRAAIRATADTDLFFTGTVERLDLSPGVDPEPHLALSARLISADDGRILWMNGADRRGRDRQKLFGRNRIRSPGALAEEVLGSLVAGLPTSPPGTPEETP